ncbi:uncharacterized protein [Periplaneta americana]|uniref:uncharacterized protein n=1 Tax=Periplaneta americana TaxID=6978 RepID=UPI0037E89C9E
MFGKLSIKDLAAIALLLDEDESKVRKRKTPKRKWVNRNRKDVGEYFTLFKELIDDETRFYQYFHMPINKFETLLARIQNDIKKVDTCFREAITPREKLAVCLRFLGTGDSFRTIASSYCLGRSTTHCIIKEVCSVIIRKMKDETIPVPKEEDWKRIAADFWRLWNFPNCLGALQGKQVEIEVHASRGAPSNSYTRKFSVVLLALVDAHYRFVSVDIGAYGKTSGILSSSNMGKALESGSLNIPTKNELPGSNLRAPYVILGDESFPMKTYLMRPYPAPQAADDIPKKTFNNKLSHARQVTENAFRLLADRFQVYRRVLKSKPENLDTLILTTCILHNFLQEEDVHSSTEATPYKGQLNLKQIPRRGCNSQGAACHVRDTYKKFFSLTSVPESEPSSDIVT